MPHQTQTPPLRFRADRGLAPNDAAPCELEIAPTAASDVLIKIDANDLATIVSSNVSGLEQGTMPVLDLIALDCRSRMRRLIGKCRKTRQPQRDVFEIRGLPDCHLMFVARPQATPGPVGRLVISGCDISELIQKQRHIERQAVLLEQVLEVAPHNIFWKDKDCRFSRWQRELYQDARR